MFKCDKCGKCCKNLNKSPVYKNLHNGNGVCKYLKNNICSIYEDRPLLCRVDEAYNVFFENLYEYNEYLKINYEICKKLKRED